MNAASVQEKKRLLQSIDVYGFLISDIILFLDTHPQNREALEYYNKANSMYQKAKAEYEEKFGPLTVHSSNHETMWSWATSPMPWERGNC